MIDLRNGIIETARAIGADPLDLATVISYETAGTFDPTKRGPTTQWGQHRGLIQFGEPQAQKYGVDWNDPVGSQLGADGAVARYFRSSGYKPGMGLLDLYSTVNAGAPGLYDRSDANNGGAPGTVRDKVEQQMAGHRAKAAALLGESEGSMGRMPMQVSTQGAAPSQQPMPQEQERRGLMNPDVRDRLIMALEGMTLNPNQALIASAREGISDRRESKQAEQARNRTAEWLQSQGRDDLARAVMSGSIDGRTAFAAATAQPADDRTAGLKEYEAAVAQGFDGTFLDYKTELAQAGRAETNVNVGAGETAFDKKTGEVLATEAAEIVQQGSQAQRSLGQIATLENALQNSPSGALGSLANVAANLGIKTEGSSNIEVANAIISQLVPQQRPPGSGVMSDADLELFKQSLPRLINTREGNQKIVDTMRSIAQYDMARAQIARQLQLGQITQDEAFKAYNALGNPVAEFLNGQQGGQGSGQPRRLRYDPATGELK